MQTASEVQSQVDLHSHRSPDPNLNSDPSPSPFPAPVHDLKSQKEVEEKKRAEDITGVKSSVPSLSITISGMPPVRESALPASTPNSAPPVTLHFPDGKKETAYRYPLPEDGNSGYRALGVSRKEFVERLLKNASNATLRCLVAPEIEYMLEHEKIDFSSAGMWACDGIAENIEKLQTVKKEFENTAFKLILSSHPGRRFSEINKKKEKLLGTLKPREAMAYKEALDNFVRDRKTILQLIQPYCQTEEVFKDYVKGYIAKEGKPLICFPSHAGQMRSSSLDAVVKLNNLNVCVWKEREGKESIGSTGTASELYIYKVCQNNPHYKKINLLICDTHFDSLSSNMDLMPSSPSAVLVRSAVAPVSQKLGPSGTVGPQPPKPPSAAIGRGALDQKQIQETAGLTSDKTKQTIHWKQNCIQSYMKPFNKSEDSAPALYTEMLKIVTKYVKQWESPKENYVDKISQYILFSCCHGDDLELLKFFESHIGVLNVKDATIGLMAAILENNVRSARYCQNRGADFVGAMISIDSYAEFADLKIKPNAFRQTAIDYEVLKRFREDKKISLATFMKLMKLLERDLCSNFYPNKNVEKMCLHFSSYGEDDLRLELLHAAAKKGDSIGVQLLIEAGDDVCRRNEIEYKLAREYAAQLKHHKIEEMLAAAMKLIDDTVYTLVNEDKEVKEKKDIKDIKEVTEYLNKKRINIEQCVSVSGSTPLEMAVMGKRHRKIKELIYWGADPNKKVLHVSPLYHAILNLDLEATKLLVENGAHVSIHWLLSRERETPLKLSINIGSVEILEYLLQKGADPWHVDDKGLIALDYAIERQNFSMVEKLLGAMQPRRDVRISYKILHTALTVANLKVLELLLPHCKEIINELDTQGLSPLHLSIQKGHREVVELLLLHGASIDHLTRDGLTPLYVACRSRQPALIPILIKFGANFSEHSREGMVIEYVDKHGSSEMMLKMYEMGADIERLKSTNPTVVRLQKEISDIQSEITERKVCAESYLAPLLKAHRLGFSVAFEDIGKVTNERISMTLAALSKDQSRLTIEIEDLIIKRKIILSRKLFGSEDHSMCLSLPRYNNSHLMLDKQNTLLIKNFEMQGDFILSTHGNLALSNVGINGNFTVEKAGLLTVLEDVHVNRTIRCNVDNVRLTKGLYAKRIELFHNNTIDFSSFSQLFTEQLVVHLNDGTDITTPLKLPGSLQLILNPKAQKPFNILANIVLGTDSKDAKETKEHEEQKKQKEVAAHLIIESRGLPVTLGKEGQPYVDITATGIVTVESFGFDLVHGRIVGIQGISITSSTPELRIGRFNSAKAISSTTDHLMPSGLVTNGKLHLKANAKILFESADMYTRGGFHFIASQLIDVIASQINSENDSVVDSPVFKIRLLIERSPGGQVVSIPKGNTHEANRTIGASEKAVSASSLVKVEKTLTTTGTTEVFASYLHYKNLVGLAPKMSNFIPFQSYTDHYFCGHEDPGRSRWFREHKCKYETPIMAVLNAPTKMVLKNPILELAGIVFAPAIKLLCFDKAVIGQISVSIKLPAAKPFRQIIPLVEKLTPSPRFDYVGVGYGPLFRSVLPVYYKKSFPPPVILGEDGTLTSVSTSPMLEHLMPYEMEAELLVKTLMQEFYRSILDEKTTQPQKILYQFLLNARQLMEKGTKKGLNQEGYPLWYETLEVPLLVYKEAFFEKQFILTPFVIFPKSWNNLRLRDGAGGLFALFNIGIQGKSRNTSTLITTAHLEAGGILQFSDLKTLTHHKNTYVEERVVKNSTQQRSLFGTNTTETIKTVRTTTLEPGNTVNAEELVYKNVEKLNYNGVININVGKGGIDATKEIGEINESGTITSKLKHHQSRARNSACSAAVDQTLEEREIHRSKFNSQGMINMGADRIGLSTAEMTAAQVIILKTKKHTELGCTRVEQELPATASVSRMLSSVTTGTAEKGVGVILKAGEEVEVTSEGTIHGEGTKMLSKEVKVESEKEAVFETLRLREQYNTSTGGLDGLRLVDRQKNACYESGLPTTLIAEHKVEMLVKNGDLILIAPVLFSGGEICLRASKGTVYLKPAEYHQDITEEEYSAGLKFFGSTVIEAAMRRDFKDAANQLLREFPLLDSIGKLMEAKDTADKVSSGMKTLFYAYKAYKDFSKAESSKEFVASQIQLNIKVRFGTASSKHHWTELALPWLQAKHIIMTGKNVVSVGTQGTCEELKILVERDATVGGAARTMSSHSTSAGLTLGVSIPMGAGTNGSGSLPVSAGIDYSESERNAQECIMSRFNVSKLTTIVAGGKLSVRGVMIETLKAVINAESAHFETLQNTSSETHFSASASTDMAFSLSSGYSDSKWAGEQTGIHARETLLMNIRKEMYLIGAKLTLGNQAKPLLARSQDGKTLSFYEYSFGANDLNIVLDLHPHTIIQKIFKDEVHFSKSRAIQLESPQDWFKAAILRGSLPLELQNEQTRWLQHHSASMPPAEFLKKLNDYMTEARTAEFVMLSIRNLNAAPPLTGQPDYRAWLNLLSKIMNANVRVWEMNEGALKVKFETEPMLSDTSRPLDTIELCYSPNALSCWSLLHTKPGLINAQEIIGKTVKNRQDSQSTSVAILGNPLGPESSCKVTVGLDHQSKEEQENLNAVIGGPIDKKVQKITNVKDNENESREKTRDESTHIGAFIPVANPVAFANEAGRTLTTKPLMFSDKEPPVQPPTAVPSDPTHLSPPHADGERKSAAEGRADDRTKDRSVSLPKSKPSAGNKPADANAKPEPPQRLNEFQDASLMLARDKTRTAASKLDHERRVAERHAFAQRASEQRTFERPFFERHISEHNASERHIPERRTGGVSRKVDMEDARKSHYYKKPVTELVAEKSRLTFKKRGYHIPEHTLAKLAENQVNQFLSGTTSAGEMRLGLAMLGGRHPNAAHLTSRHVSTQSSSHDHAGSNSFIQSIHRGVSKLASSLMNGVVPPAYAGKEVEQTLTFKRRYHTVIGELTEEDIFPTRRLTFYQASIPGQGIGLNSRYHTYLDVSRFYNPVCEFQPQEPITFTGKIGKQSLQFLSWAGIKARHWAETHSQQVLVLNSYFEAASSMDTMMLYSASQGLGVSQKKMDQSSGKLRIALGEVQQELGRFLTRKSAEYGLSRDEQAGIGTLLAFGAMGVKGASGKFSKVVKASGSVDNVSNTKPIVVTSKQQVKYLEKELGVSLHGEHLDFQTGSGGLHGYENFAKARSEASIRANLGNDAVPFLQKRGPYRNEIYTGMQNKDKTRGWRLDFDPDNQSKGMHINWWFAPDATKRKVIYEGSIKIEATPEVYWDILSHFPKR